jgi:hypothetical protein
MSAKRLAIVFVMLIVLLPLVACSGGEAGPMTQPLPDFITHAPQSVQTAYLFAMEHPDMLTHQPCYCGCGPIGHMSSLHCFIRDIDDNGTIIFDRHGAGCGICVDIALDVKRLSEEGYSSLAIRHYIDATYSFYGPPTNTAMPEA